MFNHNLRETKGFTSNSTPSQGSFRSKKWFLGERKKNLGKSLFPVSDTFCEIVKDSASGRGLSLSAPSFLKSYESLSHNPTSAQKLLSQKQLCVFSKPAESWLLLVWALNCAWILQLLEEFNKTFNILLCNNVYIQLPVISTACDSVIFKLFHHYFTTSYP